MPEPRQRIAFLLGKDPRTARGGDVTMSGVLRTIAAERFDVELICLSEQPGPAEPGTVRVAKPAVSLPTLAARSAVRRRSLVHCRFDVPALREAVESSRADRFVAIHAYMAEAYLGSARARPGRDLLVSSEVSEADVWRSRGLAGAVEARRLARDEARVHALARAVGGYDRVEVERWRRDGVAAHWLPVTLPPVDLVDRAATAPRLVLLGNRTWGPNARAAERLVGWWPEIAAGIAGAEMLLVGARPTARPRALPPGVTDLGEVPDVDAVLAGSRALAAPIEVGGGVRVKMLEAAARGLPVVTTPAGVGTLEAELGIAACVGREAFVARCRTLLQDADDAAAAGSALHAANARRWRDRVGHDAVLGWLAA